MIAAALLPELGSPSAASTETALRVKPADSVIRPAIGAAPAKPVAPAAAGAAQPAATIPLGKPGTPPAAPIGLSVGFGGQSSEAERLKP